MSGLKKIKSALISVYHKDKLDEILKKLNEFGVKIYSTGGTKTFIESLGYAVTAVEDLTTYPSILGGRVKTLHPKVFGGILSRRDKDSDVQEIIKYEIPEIDLVIVDLYPFEETIATGGTDEEIIEKIDIGGISLIRAAAKNFNDVVIIPSQKYYDSLLNILVEKKSETDIETRKAFAKAAFDVSSHYDSAIYKYFSQTEDSLKISIQHKDSLRYGENPHQMGVFFGDMSAIFEKIAGKEISYNNLLDIDAAINLIADFTETTFAVIKHNNACGLASRNTAVEAWKDALAGDTISAFGGIIITNKLIDAETAQEIDKIFFEVVIAPDYSKQALELLSKKKNRIILKQKSKLNDTKTYRSALNGMLVQEKDLKVEVVEDLKVVTKLSPSKHEIEDLLFANKLVKHTKSNTIVLTKNKQLLGSGTGQTSRIDALKQAIVKAEVFGFDLHGSVMASDAFFPFADSVEIAHKAGITAIIQPGGSIKDHDSIDYCNLNGVAMVFTGIRHFKH
ncbi:MAG TPA: bifunctional phosphoribosylaminoimidazolecarboxamide formyltransferase/IMP cyclohydrolase PurH [Bacteroidales bacterium]|nr:MAG: bifunctional phosphoribosylaminoimidazolecarboxamide formyltransferase/IMP cyclohydrolase [Bacteroidetes bacterium GWF2_33_38]OFY76661.1 MAG: bifunctional phosphoribosylaminoimidazolecarboxamide formyltransferase/IMP cyclohydrolase [Bacteroidetes bacterium RIFOXYA12_FULL_33_9]OFY86777.1 MAG: bifunctional phosphoribosylaminoimidazolecarboxamide formyltransferase/IMP cyclohydrolase [Bacteroidetes bacterium RIFOXYA2_FULL_33_7]HBF88294.1 bifunctional phosphoribosylaminoimidazolecarboxamide f